MGIPIKKIAEIGLGVAGAAGVLPNDNNKKLLETEAKENELLVALLKAQNLTNTLLFKIIQDQMSESEFAEFVEELQS